MLLVGQYFYCINLDIHVRNCVRSELKEVHAFVVYKELEQLLNIHGTFL